ncbi:hypothetical protein SCP_1102020 [Sparassis crispa]|uniref:F-box domain-containing protein n=1 Tax=Sparassis crispa TaxID=139825 RepID=A0A401GZC7_9APHY|nr:hypothetical protein SCP_1102020 [Sparassis crispa]GBE87525.1 hypothetical protein SCP_1102020 [Sparassis crispa]
MDAKRDALGLTKPRHLVISGERPPGPGESVALPFFKIDSVLALHMGLREDFDGLIVQLLACCPRLRALKLSGPFEGTGLSALSRVLMAVATSPNVEYLSLPSINFKSEDLRLIDATVASLSAHLRIHCPMLCYVCVQLTEIDVPVHFAQHRLLRFDHFRVYETTE